MGKTNMKVPLFDLSRVLSPYKLDLLKAAEAVINKSDFIMGDSVSLFELNFKKNIGSKYCAGVSSGTDAILSIFMALDLPPGSEIIVPSFTFVASATSILRAGYKPIFADIGRESYLTNLEEIKKVWTERTRGVLFVHLFGEYADLSDIKKHCDTNNAYLIEDCAQSFGSRSAHQGLASAFSFFPAKNLGCLGDGGAVTTDDKDLFQKIKAIRTHGSIIKYEYTLIGGNFRLDTMQAAFLNVLLENSDVWISKRKENANYYNEKLKGIKGLSLPPIASDHAWNQYTIKTGNRNGLLRSLRSKNIGAAVYYPSPVHKSVIFNDERELPNTALACKEVLSIPIYPGLQIDERAYVADSIIEFYNEK